MESEQNKGIVRRVIEEAYNRGEYRVLNEVFDPNFTEHQFGLRAGIDGMREDVENLRRRFPDLTLTIEDMAAVGDRVWVLATARGTNTGGFMGPPNGRRFSITVFDLLRLENGRIVEHWGAPDRFALLAQLGLLPQAEGALRDGGRG